MEHPAHWKSTFWGVGVFFQKQVYFSMKNYENISICSVFLLPRRRLKNGSARAPLKKSTFGGLVSFSKIGCFPPV